MTKTTESFDVIMSFPYLEFWGHFITYKTDPKFFKEAHKVLQALAWVHIPTLPLPAMCSSTIQLSLCVSFSSSVKRE